MRLMALINDEDRAMREVFAGRTALVRRDLANKLTAKGCMILAVIADVDGFEALVVGLAMAPAAC